MYFIDIERVTAAKKLVRKSIRLVKFSRLELPFKPPVAGTVLTESRSSLSLRRAVSVRCLISSKAFSNSILACACSVTSIAVPTNSRIGVQNAGWRNPPVQDWGKTFPPHLGALSFVGQLFEILRHPDGTIKYQHSIGRPIVNEKGDLVR